MAGEALAYVRCVVIGASVVCGECTAPMRPVRYRNLEAEELTWMFWRCTGDRDHVTPALPLPAISRH